MKSLSLFEDGEDVYAVDEMYAELRGPNNEVEFKLLVDNVEPFVDKKSNIKALPPLPWRVRK